MDCLCRPSRIMSVRINLLDETDFIHEIKDDLPGQALLDVVFARLNLIETTYFGIRYIDEENQTHWLDPASRISRQLKPKPDAYDLYFGVKFYAADPCKLLEEITRYQLFLQIKQDVLQGRLPVAFELAAELGAFVIQSELGDYDARRHSKGYVSEFRLLPNQSSELETRVAELHQQLKGMSPAAAELNYLDKVKWHDMYGVDLHPVLGEDSVEYFLGLTPSGIVVLRNKTTVAHYYWPRIAKVYYKGRYFMLRISDKNNELSTYGFETPRKSACKHLWRCCVEHHAFFRSMRVAPLPTSQSNASDLFQLGSRLKYGARSEKQTVKDALSIGRAPPAFTRVPSKRQPRRVIDDFLNGSSKNVENFTNTITTTPTTTATATTINGPNNALEKNIINSSSIAAYESPYRSTYSIPTSLGIRPYGQQPPSAYSHNSSNYNANNSGANSNLQTPDSPRSTRSAPWPRSQQRSLFGQKPSSPRSVRSASITGGSHGGGGGSNGHHHHHHHHHHSSHRQQPPIPGQQHQQQQQQRYRSSSVESHSSNDSRSTRRHKHRHRRTSDNESELSRGSARSGPSHHRKHRRSRHRRDSGGSDHDSTRGRSYSGHRSSSARSGGSAELIDSTSQWREVQRRQAEASLGLSSVQQASVSKSSAVARSLHSNDSHSDTHSHHRSRRHRKNKSPSESRNRIWSSELAKHLQFDLVDTTGMTEDQLREIPYTVVETNSKRSNSNLKIHKSNSKNSVGGKSNGSGNTLTNGSGSASGQGKNRVDRIRGLYFQSSHPGDATSGKNGSIRSASTISSRECERNSGLVRMMSSMSMGDFISPTGSNLSPLENSALRVSHEHTDSGLGADQDYAYSSERSSDSTRYGTNQSSGASSGSHRKSTYNSLMQQTVSNQQHHHQQQQQHHHHYQQQQQQQQSQRQNSLYATQRQQQPQQQQTQKPINYPKTNQTPSKTLAPIHNSHHASIQSSLSSSITATTTTSATTSTTNNPQSIINNSNISINMNNNNNTNNHNNHFNHNNTGNGNETTTTTNNSSKGNNNRLLNYTTFENNQYKFSLNNVFGKSRTTTSGGGMSGSATGLNGTIGAGAGASASASGGGGLTNTDRFAEWSNTPAAPYYYHGPSTSSVAAKKRDAKSDIGVPTRRLSGQVITKTQLLTGQLPNVSCYPMPTTSAYPGGGGAMGAFDSRLHPAKSDLFISYIQSGGGECERPYIYNYKMPQMPEFLRPLHNGGGSSSNGSIGGGVSGNNSTAYHISGAHAADPPPLYKPSSSGGGSGGVGAAGMYAGATAANDVMYYQFDNGQPPIVQQPKPSSTAALTTAVGGTAAASAAAGTGAIGPLVFVQHGATASANPSAAASATQQTCTNNNTNTTTTNITTTTTTNAMTTTITNTTATTTTTTTNINTNTTNSSSLSHSSPCSEDDLDEVDEEDLHEDDMMMMMEEEEEEVDYIDEEDEFETTADEADAHSYMHNDAISPISSNNAVNNNINQQHRQRTINTTTNNCSTNINNNNNNMHVNSNGGRTISNGNAAQTISQSPINNGNSKIQTTPRIPNTTIPGTTTTPHNISTIAATTSTTATTPNANQIMTMQSPNANTNPSSISNSIRYSHTNNQNREQLQLQQQHQQLQPNSYAQPLVHAPSQINPNHLQNQNQGISSSLEIILSPIIQSSRRAQ